MFITGSSDVLPLPPVVGKNDVSKIEASKQSFQSDPPVREDGGVRYFSPVVRIDPESQQAIIIFREADGEVTRQYPSEKELEAYRDTRFTSNPSIAKDIAAVLPDIGTEDTGAGVRTTNAPTPATEKTAGKDSPSPADDDGIVA